MLDAVSNQEKISRLKELLLRQTSPSNKQPQKEPFTLSKTAFRKPSSVLLLEQRILQLEEKLNFRLDQQWRLLECTASEVEMLQDEAKLLRKDVERSKSNAEQRAMALEREVIEEMTEQCEEIRGIRRELLEGLETKYRQIKIDTMAVISSQFESGWDRARNEIVKDLQRIRQAIEIDKEHRDEVVNFLVVNFGQEILQAEQMVQKEREERAETHKKLVASIAIVEEQATNLILQQRRESAAGIQNLEGYLEELCFKIEGHLLR